MRASAFLPAAGMSLLFLFSISIFAQTGTLRGKVTDKATGEEVPFANISLLKNKVLINSAVTDLSGDYKMTVAPGKYDLKVTYVGYDAFYFSGITIKKDSISKKNVSLVASSKKLEEVMIVTTESYDDISYDAMPDMPPTMEYEAPPPPPTDGKFLSFRGSTFKTKVYGTDGSGYNGARSGLLTAGEISDFSKWDLWKDIADNQLGEWQKSWEFKPTERYTVQVMNASGKPLIGCTVKLLSSNGSKVWLGYTDNTGKAELWTNMFEEKFKVNEKYSIVASWKESSKTIENVKKLHDGINIITFDAACDVPNKMDVVFMVDATGSMGDEINYLKAELNDILVKVKDAHKDLEVKTGAVFYRDVTDAYTTKRSALTTNLDKTIDFIKQQSADGGGDFPEAVDRGLDTAIFGMNWDKDARTKLLFLVLDAPPHNTPEIREKLRKATMKAAELGIRIIPLTASGIDKSTEYLMRSFALATNGTYVFLTDDSGIGGSHIKPTTDKFEVETLNALLLRLFFQYTSAPSCNDLTTTKVKADTTIVLGKDTIKDTNVTVQTKIHPGDTLSQTSTDTSKHSIHLKSMKCFPNPTSGIVHIEIKGTVSEIFLADVGGKLLRRYEVGGKEDLEIDISDLPSGIYFIQCLENEKWKAGKIILQR